MSSGPWWVAFVVWLCALALCLYARRRRRGPRELTYDWREGMTPVARMTEALLLMSHGKPSLTTWRRRCEASLAASRRRRGLR